MKSIIKVLFIINEPLILTIQCSMVAFFRFIGELFKLKMLTEGIMHDCLLKLLRSNDEDSLECLCRLVTTVGKELDHAKAKVSA